MLKHSVAVNVNPIHKRDIWIMWFCYQLLALAKDGWWHDDFVHVFQSPWSVRGWVLLPSMVLLFALQIQSSLIMTRRGTACFDIAAVETRCKSFRIHGRCHQRFCCLRCKLDHHSQRRDEELQVCSSCWACVARGNLWLERVATIWQPIEHHCQLLFVCLRKLIQFASYDVYVTWYEICDDCDKC